MKLTLLKLFTFILAASVFAVIIFVKPSGNIGGSRQTFSASIAKVFPAAPTESRILVQSPRGGGVWVNNFYKAADGADESLQAVLIKRAEKYNLLYYPVIGGFELALSLSASRADRTAAEQDVFGILGASKSDICRLEISVSELTSSGDKTSSRPTVCQGVFK